MAYRDPLEAAAERSATLTAELARVEAAITDNEDLARQRDRLRLELAHTNAWGKEATRKRHLAMVDTLSRVAIAKPCDVHWEHMPGTSRKRHCGACARDVHDLSAHTLEEADALISQSAEAPCLRFYRREDGTIVTGNCAPADPYPSDRLATRIAAVGVLVLVAGAYAVATVPQMGRPCRVTQSRSDALEVRSAVLLYMGQDCGAYCPTMDELQEAGVLDSSRRTNDAWDVPFAVDCEGDDIVVVSAGPDRSFGTEDDLRL